MYVIYYGVASIANQHNYVSVCWRRASASLSPTSFFFFFFYNFKKSFVCLISGLIWLTAVLGDFCSFLLHHHCDGPTIFEYFSSAWYWSNKMPGRHKKFLMKPERQMLCLLYDISIAEQ